MNCIWSVHSGRTYVARLGEQGCQFFCLDPDRQPIDFMVLQAGFEPAAPGLGILIKYNEIELLQIIVVILGAFFSSQYLGNPILDPGDYNAFSGTLPTIQPLVLRRPPSRLSSDLTHTQFWHQFPVFINIRRSCGEYSKKTELHFLDPFTFFLSSIPSSCPNLSSIAFN